MLCLKRCACSVGTFAECKNQESVVIPQNAYQISKSTFMNCTNFKDVWIYSYWGNTIAGNCE